MTSRPCIQVLREIVLGEPSKSRKAALFMYFITFVIIISILSTCTQTIRSVRSEPTARSVFLVVNIFTSVIFTIELLLRFIVALTPDQATTSSVIRAVRGLLTDPLTWYVAIHAIAWSRPLSLAQVVLTQHGASCLPQDRCRRATTVLHRHN